MEQRSNKVRVVLIYVVLVAVTVIAFERVRKNEFVNYDDDKYVTNNPQVQVGLTYKSVVWAFTRWHASNWHPLTWLSHMLDCELFGLDAGRHHLMNLLFHALNTVLLFWVLNRMSGSVWPGAFVAGAFALHPVHVESVAWIAERKDVLSGLFWMLTIAAYVRYAERPGIGRYLLVVAVFCLGLTAKPMLVTLPFVLLLLDYWPLGRLRLMRHNSEEAMPQPESVTSGCQSAQAQRLIVEKIPLFVCSAGSSVVTYLVQQKSGAMVGVEIVPLNMRIANGVVSYIRYIGKMFYPKGLSALYPLPREGIAMWQVVVSLSILIVVSALVIYIGRRRGYLLTGWLWYVGTLVPVIGLVQVGGQSMADRYTYLPSIGIFIMFGWGGTELLGRWRYGRIGLGISAGLLLVVWLFCTRVQVGYWQNDITLFNRAIEVNADSYIMHNNLGLALKEANKSRRAIRHFNKSLKLRENVPEVHNNLGNALVDQKKFKEAIGHYKRAVELRRGFVEARLNLANALRRQASFSEAVEHYRRALKRRPKNANGHYGLGLALAELERFDEAVKCYKRALRLEPDLIRARYELGAALFKMGELDAAMEQFHQVLRVYPEDAEMHCNLGVLLAQKGCTDEAIEEFRTALRFEPELLRAREQLEAALARKAEPDLRTEIDTE